MKQLKLGSVQGFGPEPRLADAAVQQGPSGRLPGCTTASASHPASCEFTPWVGVGGRTAGEAQVELLLLPSARPIRANIWAVKQGAEVPFSFSLPLLLPAPTLYTFK